MKRLIGISFLICYFLIPCFAEHEKVTRVKKIRGEYHMTVDMDISAKAATQFALEEAQKNALIEVCGSKMNAWDMAESSAAGESFNSLNVIQVDGEIVDYEIVEQGQITNPIREKELIFYCVINASVKKGLEQDPNFKATIKGLKASYVSGAELKFSIVPYREAYVKVFIFESAELGLRISPNAYEEPFKMNPNKEYAFPTNDYSYYPITTDQNIETDRLVFVFTKTEYPYYAETTSRKEIESWIASIPNDQKFVYYTAINILKE